MILNETFSSFSSLKNTVFIACRYSWALSELEEAQGASLLVAADVIYSDNLTDAFFNMLEKCMSQGSEKVCIHMLRLFNFILGFQLIGLGLHRL